MTELLQNWKHAGTALGILAGAGILGYLVATLLWRILRRLSRRTRNVFDDAVIRHAPKPARLLLAVLFMHVVRPVALQGLTGGLAGALSAALTIAFILSTAWLLTALVSVVEEVLLAGHSLEEKDNLATRKLYTQVDVLKRILIVVIVILSLAAVLLSFDKLRQIGTGILASAGIAGIILGLAAQRTLSNLLAGFQIAVSQPIRIDDVLVVEGEWGRVEEITLTYVVFRIWDLRRLILPISYFIEKPFQNWTRVSADVLGTVYLYVDYAFPVDSLRPELHRLLEGSPDWDGKAEGIVVTGAGEHTLEVRALVSAEDSSKLWSLRCLVREKLIEFVRTEHPECLPRFRAELRPEAEGSRPGGGDAASPRGEDRS